MLFLIFLDTFKDTWINSLSQLCGEKGVLKEGELAVRCQEILLHDTFDSCFLIDKNVVVSTEKMPAMIFGKNIQCKSWDYWEVGKNALSKFDKTQVPLE